MAIDWFRRPTVACRIANAETASFGHPPRMKMSRRFEAPPFPPRPVYSPAGHGIRVVPVLWLFGFFGFSKMNPCGILTNPSLGPGGFGSLLAKQDFILEKPKKPKSQRRSDLAHVHVDQPQRE